MKKVRVYVVTNYGGGKNYTPSIFVDDENEARRWFKELSANNIKEITKIPQEILDQKESEEKWDNIIDFVNGSDIVDVYRGKICIGEPEEGGNVIQFFDYDLFLDNNSSIYVVTNYGGGENYTPSVFANEEEARRWFKAVSAENLRGYLDEVLPEELRGKDHAPTATSKKLEEEWDAILTIAMNHTDSFDVEIDQNNEIIVGDPDNGGNIIQFFTYNSINL